MNGDSIARDLELTLLRYKRGLISLSQAREELAFCVALLKGQEQAVLEQRLERLEAVMLENRGEQRAW